MPHRTALPLAVTDLGSGSGPTVLLIPGWCGDRSVFDPVLPGLTRHRRAVSVDLPGHGESPAPADDFGTADVVDALVHLVERLSLPSVVPVALSHAGWAAIELRRRLGPEVVRGLVLLDWMVLGPPPGFADALGGLQSPAWRDVRQGLFDRWTTGVPVPELHAYVDSMSAYDAEHWHRAGREIAAGFEAEGSPLAALDRLQPCPTLHLFAQPQDADFLGDQQEFATTHPWFCVRRLGAASHFPMYEVPDEMAAAVGDFVSDL